MPREDDRHAFIVRIWREPREIPGATPKWRGWIEHVASKEHRAFEDLYSIVTFIEPYLMQLGVRLAVRQRIRRTLSRLLDRLG